LHQKFKLDWSPKPTIEITPVPPKSHTLPGFNIVGQYDQYTKIILIVVNRYTDTIAATMVHELMHAYLHQQKIAMIDPNDEEGLCELVSFLYYRNLLQDDRVANNHRSKVVNYEAGFAKAYSAFQKAHQNLQLLVKHCKETRKL
jgi:predicted SprT family Zn-dependent metalloprotease